jgi:hypothetical protein
MGNAMRGLVALALSVAAGTAIAATVEEDALAAAEAWARAVSTHDVDAEMKFLPPTVFVKPGDQERQRAARARDKETAVLNGEKYLSFQVRPAVQTAKINKATAVVLPYTWERQTLAGKLRMNSSVIALNDGGTWYVIDGTGQNPRSLKILIPGYNGELSLPPARSMVIKPE